MVPIKYTECDNSVDIEYRALYNKRQNIKIIFNAGALTIVNNGKERYVNLNGLTDVIYTVSQDSPPKQAYSQIFIVTCEVYFKTNDEPIEIATFLTYELKDLLLRNTEGFKLTEALASKLGSHYNLNSKFQYEIETKAKNKGLYWVLGAFVFIWFFLFLMIYLSGRK